MIELDILHSIKPIEVEGQVYAPHKGEEGAWLPDKLGKAMIKRGWAKEAKATFLTVKGAELKAVAQWLKNTVTISGSKVGDNGITTHFVDATNIYGGKVFTPAEWIEGKGVFAFDSERLTKCLWTCKKGEEIDIKVRPSTLEIRDRDGRQWLHKLPSKEQMQYIKDTKKIKTGSIKVFFSKEQLKTLKRAIMEAVKEGKKGWDAFEDIVFITEGEDVGVYLHGYGDTKKVYSVYTGDKRGDSVAVYSLDAFSQVLKGVKPRGKTEGLKLVYDEGKVLKATFGIGSSKAVVYIAGKIEERREEVRKALKMSSPTPATPEGELDKKEEETNKDKWLKEQVAMDNLVIGKNETEEETEEGRKINISYGGSSGGLLYGAGYGKSEEVSALIQEVAKKVLKAFPSENFTIRCNTDGQSCGVYNDKETIGVSVDKVTSENIQVQRNLKRKAREGEILFSGMVKNIVKEKADSVYKGTSHSVYFETGEEALNWVKVHNKEEEEKSAEVKQLKDDIRIDEETLEKAEKEEENLEPEAGEEEIFNADAPRLEEDLRQAKAELDKIQEQEEIEHEKAKGFREAIYKSEIVSVCFFNYLEGTKDTIYRDAEGYEYQSNALNFDTLEINKIKELKRIDKAATDAAELVEREKTEEARGEVIKEGVSFLTIHEANGTAFHNSKEVYEEMKAEAQIDRECMWVLHLTGGKVLKKELVAMGKGNAAYTTPREVYRRAIIEGATKIIMVHNHPSGDPTPSDADISTCEDYLKAGKLLGIELLDFLVIGTQGYTSFADKGIGGF